MTTTRFPEFWFEGDTGRINLAKVLRNRFGTEVGKLIPVQVIYTEIYPVVQAISGEFISDLQKNDIVMAALKDTYEYELVKDKRAEEISRIWRTRLDTVFKITAVKALD